MAERHLVAKIKDVESTGKPLVVLLKGPGKDSSMMEMILRTSGLATLRDQATLFVMSASEQGTTSMPPVTQALHMASMPGIQPSDLPVVLVLNGDGKALSVTRGLVTAGELQQSLTDAITTCQPSTPELSDPAAGMLQPLTPSASTAGNAPDSTNPPATPAAADSRSVPPAVMSPSAATQANASRAAIGAAATQHASSRPAQEGAAAPEKPLVDVNQTVQLQLHLPDGQAMRASFKGTTLLQEICSYVSQQRPGESSRDYRVVSLHLGKEFSETDVTKSLAELGVQSQTSLRLRRHKASAGGGGALLAQLMQLLVTFNPMNLLRWVWTQIIPTNQDLHRDTDRPPAQQPEGRTSAGATGRQTGNSQAVKRRNAQPGKVHTVHDAEEESQSDDADSNKYWNGNSTQFDADDQ